MKQNANMMQVGVCSEMECLNTDWKQKNKTSVDKWQFAFGFPPPTP